MLKQIRKIKRALCALCVISMLGVCTPVSLMNAFAESISVGDTVSITLSNDNGIYYEGDPVNFTVNFTSSASHSVTVQEYADLTGYLKKEFTSQTNTAYTLNGYSTGWYRVILKNRTSGKEVSAAFAVVPREDSRYQGEVPFATDLAANSILKDADKTRAYAEAAKKARFGWVRERYSWWTKTDGQYNFSSFEEAINRESAAGLNVIATSNDYKREGYSTKEQMFTDDLFKVYNYQKEMTDYFGDKVDMWEIWNEADNDNENFSAVAPDMYSSFYKAAAIAVKDSRSDSRVTFGGLCKSTDKESAGEDEYSDYAEIMMKNDVLRYSDVYNVHSHTIMSTTQTPKFNTEFLDVHEENMLSGGYRRPIWVSEAGIGASLSTTESVKGQARYAVTSAVESISAGADKHFWFILPNFKEGSRQYGVFDSNGQPTPAYAALSVATKMLGKGEYKGKYNSDSFNGYVFNNGTNDVLVAWVDDSSAPTIGIGSGDKAYDFMGKQKSGTVKASNDPIYVVYAQGLDASLYTAAQAKNIQEAEPLTAKDRIVIQADFRYPSNFKYRESIQDIRKNGYRIGENEPKTVSMKIYNFNDTDITGTLRGSAEEMTISGSNVPVTIPAKSSITQTVTLTANNSVTEKENYVSFWVETSDGNSSKISAKFAVNNGIKIDTSVNTPDRAWSGSYKRSENGLGFVFDNSVQVDLVDPVELSGAEVSDNSVVLKDASSYATYEVYVPEDASYYLKSTMTASSILFTVNGESISRRCGRTVSGSDYTMLDEVQLKAGRKNIVKIHGYAGTVSALSFKKLSKKQYTTAMNTYAGGRTFDDTNINVIGVDPWLPMNADFAAIPKDSEATPYVTFNVTIPESGYYYPAVAKGSGGSNVKFTINNEEVLINENCTIEDEIFVVGKNNAQILRYNESIYLEAGTYPLKLSLYLPANSTATSWNTNIAAVRFYEAEAQADDIDNADDTPWVEYDIDVEETGAYRVLMNASLRMKLIVNGSDVSYKSGRAVYSAGGANCYIFDNTVPLYKGKNTVRIAQMKSGDSYESDMYVSDIILIKSDDVPRIGITARAITDAKTNVTGLGFDPWADISTTQAAAPYIRWNIEVPETGKYYVELAYNKNGTSTPNIRIGRHTVSFDDCTELDEYCLQSTGIGNGARWRRSADEPIVLEKGRYEVELRLTRPEDASDWKLKFAGFRLAEAESLSTEMWAEASKQGRYVKVSYDKPNIAKFDIIMAEYIYSGGEKILKNLYEPISVQANDGRDIKTIATDGKTGELKIFMWNRADRMLPLCESIGTRTVTRRLGN